MVNFSYLQYLEKHFATMVDGTLQIRKILQNSQQINRA